MIFLRMWRNGGGGRARNSRYWGCIEDCHTLSYTMQIGLWLERVILILLKQNLCLFMQMHQQLWSNATFCIVSHNIWVGAMRIILQLNGMPNAKAAFNWAICSQLALSILVNTLKLEFYRCRNIELKRYIIIFVWNACVSASIRKFASIGASAATATTWLSKNYQFNYVKWNNFGVS